MQRQLRSLVTENLPVKFSALFFAVVLWVIVRSEEPSEAWIDVRLALTLDSTVTMSAQPPSLQALVSGRGPRAAQALQRVAGAAPLRWRR